MLSETESRLVEIILPIIEPMHGSVEVTQTQETLESIIDGCDTKPAVFITCGNIENISHCASELTGEVTIFVMVVTDCCADKNSSKELCIEIAKNIVGKPLNVTSTRIPPKGHATISDLSNQDTIDRRIDVSVLSMAAIVRL